MNQRHIETPPSAILRIAFVQSSWHRDIVDRACESFLSHLRSEDATYDVELFHVPGAFEIPLRVKMLARTGRYAAIVACGFVVDGGIYRHEFVASATINGLMQVQLETDVPVFSIVLTPQHFHEHAEHRDFFRQHFIVKGREAANACRQTLESFGLTRETGRVTSATTVIP